MIHKSIFEIQYAIHSLVCLKCFYDMKKEKKTHDGTLRKNNGDDGDEYFKHGKID